MEKRIKYLILIAFFTVVLVPSANIESAPLRDVPVTITQPNGEIIDCFASGDEFFNWLHDQEGYVIIQDPLTGYYTYALKSMGNIIPSHHIVGKVDPGVVGLERHIKPSSTIIIERLSIFSEGSPANPDQIVKAPRTGTFNNLAVFIRFSDEAEFTDQISYYDNLFNSNIPGYNSMDNYFKEVSYSQLTISSSFYPTPSEGIVVSYQDSHPRGYYQPYNSTTNTIGYQGGDDGLECRDREHTLLKNAVDAINSQVPSSLNIDQDNDGNADNVIFIIKGSPTGWSSLLWPHQWSLYSQNATINGKRVYTYNFQLQTSLQSNGAGVLCHEMFHSLGSPDLYHYSYDGLNPVYKWDIMEYDLNPPQHMGAFMKYRYGTWISQISTITQSGTYTLNPLTSSTNNTFRINSPNSPKEYFIVEYRKKIGTFESSLTGEGLLIYRINSSLDGKGNEDGPPDEVYIYRPGGTTSADGTPDNANFSSNVGRTAINDSTNPSSFLSNGSTGGLNISNIGSIGNTISFYVTIGGTGTGITVTSPNEGENWAVGSTQTIHWTYTGSPGKTVIIELLKGGGVNRTIAQKASIGSSGSGSYSWKISKTQTSGSDYKIRVTSTSNSSYTDASDNNFTIGSGQTLQPPTLTSPPNKSNVSGTTVSFRWNASTGANNYHLQVSLNEGFTSLVFDQAIGNYIGADMSGFGNNGTKYWWRVRAGNGSTWSAWSSVWSFINGSGQTLQPPTLTSPPNGSNVSGTTVSFRWNASTGANNYHLQVSLNKGFTSLVFDQAIGNYIGADMSRFGNNGTKYWWRVRAGNGSTWSAWSSVWSFINH